MPVRGAWQNRTIRQLPPMPLVRLGENIPRRFLARDTTAPHWVEMLGSDELGTWTGEQARDRERAYRAWRDARAHRERLRADGVWTERMESSYQIAHQYYEQRDPDTRVVLDDFVQYAVDTRTSLTDFMNAYSLRPSMFTFSTTANSYRIQTAYQPMPSSIYYDESRTDRPMIVLPETYVGKPGNGIVYFFLKTYCALPVKDTARVLSRYFNTEEKIKTLIRRPHTQTLSSQLHPGVHPNMDEAIRCWVKMGDDPWASGGSYMKLDGLVRAMSGSYDRTVFHWSGNVWKLYVSNGPIKWRIIDPHEPDKAFA